MSRILRALRQPGLAGKVRRRLFPPKVGTVRVFGSVEAVRDRDAPGPADGPINTSFPGLTTFRGNASRSYYGEGPLPSDPTIVWEYPADGKLCLLSIDSGITYRGKVQEWCGTGWTGQPNVIEYADAIEVRIGAYDGAYHFIDGLSGRPLRPPLQTADLAKGSATSDADGYPLYYGGSRDGAFRVVAMDRPAPTVLWSMFSMTSVPQPVWNKDWDAAALQIGDYLLEGGENSWFYVVRLNRSYDADGLVQVDPEIVLRVPGYDQELLDTIGDEDVSIEGSVAFRDGVAYFANGGGLVQGWDISDILRGGWHAERVFELWVGGSVDATPVIDPDGCLYVARAINAHFPRPGSAAREREIGNVSKLDPTNPADPIVWTAHVGGLEMGDGSLGTPALYDGVVYVTLKRGAFVALDAKTGDVHYEVTLPGSSWMSPVAIDDQLLVGDSTGLLHNYDISSPTEPPRELWTIQLDGGIESTPAVWRGMIYVGTRGGRIYGIGQRTS